MSKISFGSVKSDKPCDCPKKAYYNRQEAEDVAEHQMSEGAPELRVYRCPDNEYVWHLARVNPDEGYY